MCQSIYSGKDERASEGVGGKVYQSWAPGSISELRQWPGVTGWGLPWGWASYVRETVQKCKQHFLHTCVTCHTRDLLRALCTLSLLSLSVTLWGKWVCFFTISQRRNWDKWVKQQLRTRVGIFLTACLIRPTIRIFYSLKAKNGFYNFKRLHFKGLYNYLHNIISFASWPTCIWYLAL